VLDGGRTRVYIVFDARVIHLALGGLIVTAQTLSAVAFALRPTLFAYLRLALRVTIENKVAGYALDHRFLLLCLLFDLLSQVFLCDLDVRSLPVTDLQILGFLLDGGGISQVLAEESLSELAGLLVGFEDIWQC